MKTFAMRKYRHAVPLIIYGIIYLTWFLYLERKVTKDYWVIHVALDDYIPFGKALLSHTFYGFFMSPQQWFISSLRTKTIITGHVSFYLPG